MRSTMTAMMVLLMLLPGMVTAATLVAFAQLPADTFGNGPTSGQFIEAANGRKPPFENQQPVQGFSALLHAEDDSFLVLSDNGFGTRTNSPDYLLSIYHIKVDFRRPTGGAGQIQLLNTTRLRDPQRHLPYPVERPRDRFLTGADLDPESFQRTADGSFWVGEELIPALLQFSADGVLLAPPFTLSGLAAADNPQGTVPTLPRSRGFEGMAISPDEKWLYPMLEGSVINDTDALNIYTFSVENQGFENPDALNPSYRYRLDKAATAIGEFIMYSDTGALVIERDSAQGEIAMIKKIYKLDFDRLDQDGFLIKTLVADLLDIEDPSDLNQDGNRRFTFPFQTIEGLVIINQTIVGLVNDNNYPFGHARWPDAAPPDNNEFILIEVPPLWP